MESHAFPPRQPAPKPEQVLAHLRICLEVQRAGVSQGKRPFAAILVGPDNKSVLLSHFSISHVEHAESCLARLAAIHYSQAYLWRCTLYSTWEPCAMCTGTIYWSNIGRIVYGASETALQQLTGDGNKENLTMDLGCVELLKHGQKAIQIFGPVPDIAEEVIKHSEHYWASVKTTVPQAVGNGDDAMQEDSTQPDQGQDTRWDTSIHGQWEFPRMYVQRRRDNGTA